MGKTFVALIGGFIPYIKSSVASEAGNKAYLYPCSALSMEFYKGLVNYSLFCCLEMEGISRATFKLGQLLYGSL